ALPAASAWQLRSLGRIQPPRQRQSRSSSGASTSCRCLHHWSVSAAQRYLRHALRLLFSFYSFRNAPRHKLASTFDLLVHLIQCVDARVQDGPENAAACLQPLSLKNLDGIGPANVQKAYCSPCHIWNTGTTGQQRRVPGSGVIASSNPSCLAFCVGGRDV